MYNYCMNNICSLFIVKSCEFVCIKKKYLIKDKKKVEEGRERENKKKRSYIIANYESGRALTSKRERK